MLTDIMASRPVMLEDIKRLASIPTSPVTAPLSAESADQELTRKTNEIQSGIAPIVAEGQKVVDETKAQRAPIAEETRRRVEELGSAGVSSVANRDVEPTSDGFTRARGEELARESFDNQASLVGAERARTGLAGARRRGEQQVADALTFEEDQERARKQKENNEWREKYLVGPPMEMSFDAAVGTAAGVTGTAIDFANLPVELAGAVQNAGPDDVSTIISNYLTGLSNDVKTFKAGETTGVRDIADNVARMALLIGVPEGAGAVAEEAVLRGVISKADDVAKLTSITGKLRAIALRSGAPLTIDSEATILLGHLARQAESKLAMRVWASATGASQSLTEARRAQHSGATGSLGLGSASRVAAGVGGAALGYIDAIVLGPTLEKMGIGGIQPLKSIWYKWSLNLAKTVGFETFEEMLMAPAGEIVAREIYDKNRGSWQQIFDSIKSAGVESAPVSAIVIGLFAVGSGNGAVWRRANLLHPELKGKAWIPPQDLLRTGSYSIDVSDNFVIDPGSLSALTPSIREQLTTELGRPPDDREITARANEMLVDDEVYDRLLQDEYRRNKVKSTLGPNATRREIAEALKAGGYDVLGEAGTEEIDARQEVENGEVDVTENKFGDLGTDLSDAPEVSFDEDSNSRESRRGSEKRIGAFSIQSVDELAARLGLSNKPGEAVARLLAHRMMNGSGERPRGTSDLVWKRAVELFSANKNAAVELGARMRSIAFRQFVLGEELPERLSDRERRAILKHYNQFKANEEEIKNSPDLDSDEMVSVAKFIFPSAQVTSGPGFFVIQEPTLNGGRPVVIQSVDFGRVPPENKPAFYRSIIAAHDRANRKPTIVFNGRVVPLPDTYEGLRRQLAILPANIAEDFEKALETAFRAAGYQEGGTVSIQRRTDPTKPFNHLALLEELAHQLQQDFERKNPNVPGRDKDAVFNEFLRHVRSNTAIPDNLAFLNVLSPSVRVSDVEKGDQYRNTRSMMADVGISVPYVEDSSSIDSPQFDRSMQKAQEDIEDGAELQERIHWNPVARVRDILTADEVLLTETIHPSGDPVQQLRQKHDDVVSKKRDAFAEKIRGVIPPEVGTDLRKFIDWIVNDGSETKSGLLKTTNDWADVAGRFESGGRHDEANAALDKEFGSFRSAMDIQAHDPDSLFGKMAAFHKANNFGNDYTFWRRLFGENVWTTEDDRGVRLVGQTDGRDGRRALDERRRREPLLPGIAPRTTESASYQAPQLDIDVLRTMEAAFDIAPDDHVSPSGRVITKFESTLNNLGIDVYKETRVGQPRESNKKHPLGRGELSIKDPSTQEQEDLATRDPNIDELPSPDPRIPWRDQPAEEIGVTERNTTGRETGGVTQPIVYRAAGPVVSVDPNTPSEDGSWKHLSSVGELVLGSDPELLEHFKNSDSEFSALWDAAENELGNDNPAFAKEWSDLRKQFAKKSKPLIEEIKDLPTKKARQKALADLQEEYERIWERTSKKHNVNFGPEEASGDGSIGTSYELVLSSIAKNNPEVLGMIGRRIMTELEQDLAEAQHAIETDRSVNVYPANPSAAEMERVNSRRESNEADLRRIQSRLNFIFPGRYQQTLYSGDNRRWILYWDADQIRADGSSPITPGAQSSVASVIPRAYRLAGSSSRVGVGTTFVHSATINRADQMEDPNIESAVPRIYMNSGLWKPVVFVGEKLRGFAFPNRRAASDGDEVLYGPLGRPTHVRLVKFKAGEEVERRDLIEADDDYGNPTATGESDPYQVIDGGIDGEIRTMYFALPEWHLGVTWSSKSPAGQSQLKVTDVIPLLPAGAVLNGRDQANAIKNPERFLSHLERLVAWMKSNPVLAAKITDLVHANGDFITGDGTGAGKALTARLVSAAINVHEGVVTAEQAVQEASLDDTFIPTVSVLGRGSERIALPVGETIKNNFLISGDHDQRNDRAVISDPMFLENEVPIPRKAPDHVKEDLKLAADGMSAELTNESAIETLNILERLHAVLERQYFAPNGWAETALKKLKADEQKFFDRLVTGTPSVSTDLTMFEPVSSMITSGGLLDVRPSNIKEARFAIRRAMAEIDRMASRRPYSSGSYSIDIEPLPRDLSSSVRNNLEDRADDNPSDVAKNNGKIFRGISNLQQYSLSPDGSLRLFAAQNFGGKTTGVSMTPYLDVALDYSTRIDGVAKRRTPKATVVEIDFDALKSYRLINESYDEISSSREITLPAGTFKIREFGNSDGENDLNIQEKSIASELPSDAAGLLSLIIRNEEIGEQSAYEGTESRNYVQDAYHDALVDKWGAVDPIVNIELFYARKKLFNLMDLAGGYDAFVKSHEKTPFDFSFLGTNQSAEEGSTLSSSITGFGLDGLYKKYIEATPDISARKSDFSQFESEISKLRKEGFFEKWKAENARKNQEKIDRWNAENSGSYSIDLGPVPSPPPPEMPKTPARYSKPGWTEPELRSKIRNLTETSALLDTIKNDTGKTTDRFKHIMDISGLNNMIPYILELHNAGVPDYQIGNELTRVRRRDGRKARDYQGAWFVHYVLKAAGVREMKEMPPGGNPANFLTPGMEFSSDVYWRDQDGKGFYKPLNPKSGSKWAGKSIDDIISDNALEDQHAYRAIFGGSYSRAESDAAAKISQNWVGGMQELERAFYDKGLESQELSFDRRFIEGEGFTPVFMSFENDQLRPEDGPRYAEDIDPTDLNEGSDSPDRIGDELESSSDFLNQIFAADSVGEIRIDMSPEEIEAATAKQRILLGEALDRPDPAAAKRLKELTDNIAAALSKYKSDRKKKLDLSSSTRELIEAWKARKYFFLAGDEDSSYYARKTERSYLERYEKWYEKAKTDWIFNDGDVNSNGLDAVHFRAVAARYKAQLDFYRAEALLKYAPDELEETLGRDLKTKSDLLKLLAEDVEKKAEARRNAVYTGWLSAEESENMIRFSRLNSQRNGLHRRAISGTATEAQLNELKAVDAMLTKFKKDLMWISRARNQAINEARTLGRAATNEDLKIAADMTRAHQAYVDYMESVAVDGYNEKTAGELSDAHSAHTTAFNKHFRTPENPFYSGLPKFGRENNPYTDPETGDVIIPPTRGGVTLPLIPRKALPKMWGSIMDWRFSKAPRAGSSNIFTFLVGLGRMTDPERGVGRFFNRDPETRRKAVSFLFGQGASKNSGNGRLRSDRIRSAIRKVLVKNGLSRNWFSLPAGPSGRELFNRQAAGSDKLNQGSGIIGSIINTILLRPEAMDSSELSRHGLLSGASVEQQAMATRGADAIKKMVEGIIAETNALQSKMNLRQLSKHADTSYIDWMRAYNQSSKTIGLFYTGSAQVNAVDSILLGGKADKATLESLAGTQSFRYNPEDVSMFLSGAKNNYMGVLDDFINASERVIFHTDSFHRFESMIRFVEQSKVVGHLSAMSADNFVGLLQSTKLAVIGQTMTDVDKLLSLPDSPTDASWKEGDRVKILREYQPVDWLVDALPNNAVSGAMAPVRLSFDTISKMYHWMGSRTGANMIVLSSSAAGMNTIVATTTFANDVAGIMAEAKVKGDPLAMADLQLAMKDMAEAVAMPNDEKFAIIDGVFFPFLQTRRAIKPLDSPTTDKAARVASEHIMAVDRAVVRGMVSFYYRAYLRDGMSKPQAREAAEHRVRTQVGGRNPEDLSEQLRTQTFHWINMFMREIFNSHGYRFNEMNEDRNAINSLLAHGGVIAAKSITVAFWGSILGRTVVLDDFAFLRDLYALITGDDEDEDSVYSWLFGFEEEKDLLLRDASRFVRTGVRPPSVAMMKNFRPGGRISGMTAEGISSDEDRGNVASDIRGIKIDRFVDEYADQFALGQFVGAAWDASFNLRNNFVYDSIHNPAAADRRSSMKENALTLLRAGGGALPPISSFAESLRAASYEKGAALDRALQKLWFDFIPPFAGRAFLKYETGSSAIENSEVPFGKVPIPNDFGPGQSLQAKFFGPYSAVPEQIDERIDRIRVKNGLVHQMRGETSGANDIRMGDDPRIDRPSSQYDAF